MLKSAGVRYGHLYTVTPNKQGAVYHYCNFYLLLAIPYICCSYLLADLARQLLALKKSGITG